jgi:hypothetical protein
MVPPTALGENTKDLTLSTMAETPGVTARVHFE